MITDFGVMKPGQVGTNGLISNDPQDPADQIQYNQTIVGEIKEAQVDENVRELDLSRTPLQVCIKDVDKLSPQDFTMSRRNGFGGSDTGVLMGVNPYTKLDDLIVQKATDKITAEELAVSAKPAVRKGNDLEPLIIAKSSKVFGQGIIKPADMYQFRDATYMRMDFDGVINDPKQYITDEIKIVTRFGQKHYNPGKAIYDEISGWHNIPDNIANTNATIEEKAAHYGIPPYYYTQVQLEIAAVNAPYGYLSAMFDNDWVLHIFYIWADYTVQQQIFLNGAEAYKKVLALRAGATPESLGLHPTTAVPTDLDNSVSEASKPRKTISGSKVKHVEPLHNTPNDY